MSLAEQLTDYIHAAFSGLWITTHEPDEAEREIAALARERKWKLAAWDIARGLRFPNGPQSAATDIGAGDPLAVLRPVPTLVGRLYNPADYPEQIHDLFDVAWDLPSVEPPTYLMQVAPEVYAEERQRVAARFEEAVRLAEQAFATEFSRLLAHLTERLGNGEDGTRKVFRDSAVTNLTEFFQRFRALNVSSNPSLDALVEQARRLVQGITPGHLRDNGSLRQDVASEMARVRSQVETLIVEAPRRRLVRARPSSNGGHNGLAD